MTTRFIVMSGVLLGAGILWNAYPRDPVPTLELINRARAEARLNHRVLMVEFGASWCSDCQELATKLNERNTNGYIQTQMDVVHVDVGRFDRNLDVARSMGIDVDQGIPAAVFLPPTDVPPTRKVGNMQILEHIHQLMAFQVQPGL